MSKKRIDMVGQRFGRTVVVEYHSLKGGNAQWRCKCDCGVEHVSERSNLIRGHTESCGCIMKECRVDYTGKRFGKLTALEYIQPSKWRCICDCGEEITVGRGSLTNGNTKSCGCMRAESKWKDITNQQFGRLTALSRIGRSYKWICQCSCGQTTTVLTSALIQKRTQSCGCLRRELSSLRASKRVLDWGELNLGRFKWHVVKDGERINMRSSYEVIYAQYLMSQGIEFEYEPRRFTLGPSISYLPDFYLPESDVWVEIKGKLTSEAAMKIEQFRDVTHNTLVVIGADEIQSYLPTGVNYRLFLEQWKIRYDVAVASRAERTTYGGQSIAA